MVRGLCLTCNIANIKINLPAVAAPPPLPYLPPQMPTTANYSFLPPPGSAACLLAVSIYPSSLFLTCISLPPPSFYWIFLSSPCLIVSLLYFFHPPLPSFLSCFCQPPLPSPHWSSRPCRVYTHPSLHPLAVAYLFIHLLYTNYLHFCWLASASLSSSL